MYWYLIKIIVRKGWNAVQVCFCFIKNCNLYCHSVAWLITTWLISRLLTMPSCSYVAPSSELITMLRNAYIFLYTVYKLHCKVWNFDGVTIMQKNLLLPLFFYLSTGNSIEYYSSILTLSAVGLKNFFFLQNYYNFRFVAMINLFLILPS